MKTKLDLNNTAHPQLVEVPLPLEIHPSVSEKAANLLLGVIEVLMREPQTYTQAHIAKHFSDCGSSCCILGHAAILAGFPGFADHYLIGLTIAQYTSICYVTNWPSRFCEKNGIAASDYEGISPEDGIARIEHFLRTGE